MHPTKAFLVISGLDMFAIGMTATGYVPFLLSLGLSLADVPLINVFFMGTIFLLEIPTGMLADGRSRAWSVHVGICLQAISLFVYAAAQGFWSALFAEALGGTANAFISGAFVAWLADALKNRGEGESLEKVLATSSVIQAFSILAAGFVGSWIWMRSPRVGWCVSGVVMAIAWFVSLRYVDAAGQPAHRVSEVEALKLTIQGLRRIPGLRWGAVASASFGLVFLFNYYWSPFFIECFGKNMIGLIWIPLYLAMAASGLLLRFGVIKFKRSSNGLVAALFLSGAGLATTGISGCVIGALGFAVLHEFGRGLFNPLSGTFFQKQFASENRATAGSAQSFIQTAAWSLLLLLAWAFMRGLPVGRQSIALVWSVGGGLLAALSVVLWLFRPSRV